MNELNEIMKKIREADAVLIGASNGARPISRRR